MASTLNEYRMNVYSQNGEDGLLKEAISRLGIINKYFVEFGAWDGIYLSNTYRLYKEENWSGLFIEGDSSRYRDLKSNIQDPNVKTLNVFVEISGSNSLDNLFAREEVPEDFAVLSMDIDSDEYAVWKSLKRFNPIVVVIEYNPTIPNSALYVQQRGNYEGNSARAIFELGQSKGYVCFASTSHNLLFCREDYFPSLGIEKSTLDEVRPDAYQAFVTYDGGIVWLGYPKNEQGICIHPWSGKPLPTVPVDQRWRAVRPSLVGRFMFQIRRKMKEVFVK